MSNTLIQPLSKGLIERALDRLGVQYTRDQDGDIATIIPSEDAGDLWCWFLAEGNERHIFKFLCTREPKIPQTQWVAALSICNAYHAKARFGRAMLHIQEGQAEAKLWFDASIDLSEGATEEFLQTFIGSHLASACMFYKMAHNQLVSPENGKQKSKISPQRKRTRSLPAPKEA